MEYTEEQLGVRLTVPDRPTVRQQLAYRSLVPVREVAGATLYEKYWDAAREIIDEWECEALPDINTPLDKVDDPDVADIITYATNVVAGHMNRLESVPKN